MILKKDLLQKNGQMTYKLLLSVLLLTVLLASCKSQKRVTYLKKDLIEKDTTIIKEEKSIILPQKNIILFPDLFKGVETKIPTQIIKSKYAKFKVQKIGNDLSIELATDSIISTNKDTKSSKVRIERIEIPVEVEVPVRNKFNWYVLLYAISVTILVFRKKIWWLVKKLPFPLPI